MSERIFIAPRSGEQSTGNFKKTIEDGYKKSDIESYLSSEDKIALQNETELKIWGNKPSLVSRWEKMQVDDWVLFYQKKRVTYAGHLLYKTHNKALADALWGPQQSENGEMVSWEYVFFLRDVRNINLDYKVMADLAGYNGDVVQGFLPYSDTGVQNILKQYGSVENFLFNGKSMESSIPIPTDKMEPVIELLKYKHQIILQGPPGTGKTRMAKLIADRLTVPKTLGNPNEIINDFVRNFDANSEEVKKEREARHMLLKNFYDLFPQDKLNDLTLNTYCAGKGDKENFCWWIERGLRTLGSYSPGSAFAYLIYWSQAKGEYSKHGRVKDVADDNAAMKEIAGVLQELVGTKQIEGASKYFGPSLILKILNSYYPDEFFPINSEKMIENALRLFNENYSGLNFLQKNLRLNQIFLEKKSQFNSSIDNHEFARFLWNNFNLKTGENIEGQSSIVAKGESQIIQFHPAYSYEDLVRGIVASTHDGSISYDVKNKVLASFAQTAADNPNGNYVLIIDEINRANLPAVLGELIYALEYRGEPVESVYEFESTRELILPKNLFIIGTMNTADRSVAHIDYAIRRRFAFVDILPDETVISNAQARQLFSEVKNLFSEEYLSPDFHPDNVMLGHSYFIVNDENELKVRLNYEIKPLLKEYLKDGVFLDGAKPIIEGLNV